MLIAITRSLSHLCENELFLETGSENVAKFHIGQITLFSIVKSTLRLARFSRNISNSLKKYYDNSLPYISKTFPRQNTWDK